MGTRADFYLGKGRDAEWLGSIAWDGDEIDNQIREAASPEAYRHAVESFLKTRDDATFPKDGWPWPWADSGTTDCSYWFFDDQMWSALGRPDRYVPWLEERRVDKSDDAAVERMMEGRELIEFPDMSARKRVTFGKRSGLIVLGG